MRAFVFTDPALTSRAGQFVWLAIDTDSERNPGFTSKFSLEAWPSFYVVNPQDESVALRWVGAMTVAQVESFLDDALRTLTAATPSSATDAALASADKLYASGKNAEAAELYAKALDTAPDGWPHRGRAVEALLFAYQSMKSSDKCVALAREALARLGGTPSVVTVSTGGLDCALKLKDDVPTRTQAIADMEAAVRRALADPGAAAAADDRSAAYLSLLEARKAAKDAAGARRTAEEWTVFLETQAVAVKTPEQRAVFDSHRLTAYLELGQPERAILMLEAAERDLPDDYNPPARLAAAYKAMKRWDDALAACGRALPKIYGPRKVRLLQGQADVYLEKGDRAAARRALEEALKYAESLPPGQRSETTIGALKKKLAESEKKETTGSS